MTLVSPYRAARDAARKRHEEQGLKFLEVYMNVPLSVVQSRDPKGLYKKARAGEIKNFTGIDDPYEMPNNPEIHLNSHKMSLKEEVDVIIDYLKNCGVIKLL